MRFSTFCSGTPRSDKNGTCPRIGEQLVTSVNLFQGLRESLSQAGHSIGTTIADDVLQRVALRVFLLRMLGLPPPFDQPYH